jgi:hypothetical protein
VNCVGFYAGAERTQCVQIAMMPKINWTRNALAIHIRSLHPPTRQSTAVVEEPTIIAHAADAGAARRRLADQEDDWAIGGRGGLFRREVSAHVHRNSTALHHQSNVARQASRPTDGPPPLPSQVVPYTMSIIVLRPR